MKKVSTAAGQQIRNFSQQRLTIGLDLGDRANWFCVLDEAGQVWLEEKVATTSKAFMPDAFHAFVWEKALKARHVLILKHLQAGSVGRQTSC